jgi:hypothetical protein
MSLEVKQESKPRATPGADDKFVETVLYGERLASERKGTLKELAAQAAQARKPAAPPLRAGGAEKVEAAIEVAKFVWDIIKDSKAVVETAGACTSVLSPRDKDWVHYAQAQDFASDMVSYKLDNFVGVNCYTVKFRIAGTNRARNPAFGGLWIPNVHVFFARCDATFPWQLSGKATINDKEISNVGSVEDPIPQLELLVSIKAEGKFALNWETHQKDFEFTLNARDGVKLRT